MVGGSGDIFMEDSGRRVRVVGMGPVVRRGWVGGGEVCL